jgi:flagellar biosynthesis protein FlhG
MSRKTTTEWLISHSSHPEELKTQRRAKTIAVSSGKGGVGKTSIAIKLAKTFVEGGEKVLLIDCDYNLSNTAVKLGFPLVDKFFDLLNFSISFDEAIQKDGNFHLLSACNGNFDLYEKDLNLENLIIDIIAAHSKDYDTIILDCPAGLNSGVCTLNSYADYRFVVVTPDKSSITDSYSLIKVLSKKLGVKDHHLIFNKVSDSNQYQKLTKTFLDTADHYLDCRLQVLGAIPFFNQGVDQFDRELLKVAGSKIQQSFNNLIKKFTEKNIGTQAEWNSYPLPKGDLRTAHEQDVQIL